MLLGRRHALVIITKQNECCHSCPCGLTSAAESKLRSQVRDDAVEAPICAQGLVGHDMPRGFIQKMAQVSVILHASASWYRCRIASGLHCTCKPRQQCILLAAHERKLLQRISHNRSLGEAETLAFQLFNQALDFYGPELLEVRKLLHAVQEITNSFCILHQLCSHDDSLVSPTLSCH